MSDGQLAMNTNLVSPGLFLKDSNGDLVKVGPVHVGTTAPNATPGAGGQAGNSKGEQWLDTSSSRYVFKIWDGTAWRTEDGEFVNVSGDTMTGALGVIAGTNTAPGVFFSGDTNTGIYSPGADQLAISTNAVERVEFGTSEVVFNDGGANYDFRIEGDTNANLLFVDASTDRVGIGTSSPDALLDIRSGSFYSGSPGVDSPRAFFGTGQSTLHGLRISGGPYNSASVAYIDLDNFTAKDFNVRAGFRLISGVESGQSSNNGYFSISDTSYSGSAISATERLRIDSSGRLLVGTSSGRNVGEPNQANIQIETAGNSPSLSVINNENNVASASLKLGKSRGTSNGSSTIVQSGDSLGAIIFAGADGDDLETPGAYIQCLVDGTPGTDDMPSRLVFGTTADGASSPTERMRITSGGEMLLGPNQISTSRTLSVKNIGMWNGGSNTEIGWFGGSAPTAALKFNAWWDQGVDRLQITDADFSHGVVLSQDSNAWGSYSDGRLKKDICPIEDSIALLKEIKPCRFAWKSGSQPDIGFIAQELKPVLPEAVDGDESDFRQEGDRFYGQMTVKHDKLIPVLTAALQEAIAKIEALETRLSALEAS
jgi:hypothetical protein